MVENTLINQPLSPGIPQCAKGARATYALRDAIDPDAKALRRAFHVKRAFARSFGPFSKGAFGGSS